MREVMLTAQFKSDLDSLDNSIRKQILESLSLIQENPYYAGLGTSRQKGVPNRKIMRSRVNRNFRILWEQAAGGRILLWRVGSHKMVDAITSIRVSPREESPLFTRNDADQSAVELSNLAGDAAQPQPFAHVPENILRLLGVPDEQLKAVKSLTDDDDIFELPLPDNVQATLMDILTNPNWALDDLLDTKKLLYRITVDQLEGYCKGQIKQLLLNLNEEQESYVHIRTNGPLLIKGVAGSGKTTIGLYRAHQLAKRLDERGRMFGEGSSILLLTYSKTLRKALAQLYLELYGEDLPYALAVEGYKEWMLQLLHTRGLQLNAADRGTRRQLVDSAKREVAQCFPEDRVVTRKFSQFLLDEFDTVIRARRLANLSEYKAIERVGRGSPLDRERHRPIVWAIYERYQAKLDKRNLFDWADLARLVQLHCRPLPQFDVVIVDEAQDLPPSDLHLATRLLPDYRGHRSLTLLADPAQSIYYRGIPWKEAGINIQGRTRILSKNYRNTRQILAAARLIVDRCDDLKQAEEYVPPSSSNRDGPRPVLVGYKSRERAYEALSRKVVELCQAGKYRPGDIAILAKTTNRLKELQKHLHAHYIQCAMFRADEFDILENDVKLISMHSAKGLEFPVVFLAGLREGDIPFINKYSETPLEDELQERKLFYVSMTRAAERLYLLHPQRDRCRFLYDLEDTEAIRSVTLK